MRGRGRGGGRTGAQAQVVKGDGERREVVSGVMEGGASNGVAVRWARWNPVSPVRSPLTTLTPRLALLFTLVLPFLPDLFVCQEKSPRMICFTRYYSSSWVVEIFVHLSDN